MAATLAAHLVLLARCLGLKRWFISVDQGLGIPNRWEDTVRGDNMELTQQDPVKGQDRHSMTLSLIKLWTPQIECQRIGRDVSIPSDPPWAAACPLVTVNQTWPLAAVVHCGPA